MGLRILILSYFIICVITIASSQNIGTQSKQNTPLLEKSQNETGVNITQDVGQRQLDIEIEDVGNELEELEEGDDADGSETEDGENIKNPDVETIEKNKPEMKPELNNSEDKHQTSENNIDKNPSNNTTNAEDIQATKTVTKSEKITQPKRKPLVGAKKQKLKDKTVPRDDIVDNQDNQNVHNKSLDGLQFLNVNRENGSDSIKEIKKSNEVPKITKTELSLGLDNKIKQKQTTKNENQLNMTESKQQKETIQEDNKNSTLNFKNDTSGEKHPKHTPSKRPHIVFIVADDLGWDDVSCHGSDQIMTPNIDTLFYTGVRIQQYYTDVQGTASRSALFTGKYPVKLGTQGASIKASEDRGIPVSERLLPSYLRDLGYATHLVGKWDVGKSRQHYLPTSRGFDTFYGFLGGSVDYYTYNLIEEANGTFFGLDFFDGEKPVENQQGHLTEVLTDRAIQIIRHHDPKTPLYLHLSHAAPHAGGGLMSVQAPEKEIQANEHIAHSARRLYAGLVTSLDKSIGHVIAALVERQMLENTIIVFVSDNGAATSGIHQNYGSNLPLRGLKDTPWEGGARSLALLWHKPLKPVTYSGLFHITDWLPTLVSAAGGNITKETVEIDGINQWETIVESKKSKRIEVLVTLDERWTALREGDFKIVVGDIDKENSGYHGEKFKALRHKTLSYESVLLESETYRVFKEVLNLELDVNDALNRRKDFNLIANISKENNSKLCIPTKDKGCLFNITSDPLEATDLWETHPDIVRRLTLRLRTLWSELKPRTTKRDPRANPALHKYIWTPWVNNEELKIEGKETKASFPLQVSMGELQYLVDLNMNSFQDKMYATLRNMGETFIKSVGGLFQFN